jgi:hypothetical protein
MHPICATICVREHELCDAHDGRITTNKIGETYAKSVKTGQSGLINWIIQFCQAKPIKPEHPVYKTETSSFFQTQHIDKKILIIAFQAFKNIYLHKIDMNKIDNNMTHETCINKVQSYYKPQNTVFSHITKFSSPLEI